MSSQQLEAMSPSGDRVYLTPDALPFELVEQTGIFFEEKLYTPALNLLFNTLASGTYASDKAIIPRPQHLALAATFLVHPSTTTRAKLSEEKEAPHLALRLLRLLSALVSPRSANLNQAFGFTHSQFSRSGRRYRANENDQRNELRFDETRLRSFELAQEASVWSRAEDFWHAAGWAFNCSVLHPERWQYWQTWLDFICEMLEDDWSERKKEYDRLQDQKKNCPKSPSSVGKVTRKDRTSRTQEGDLDLLRESLIFQYVCAGEGSGKNRRIIRAIFADGSTAAVNEFREVFHNELKLPKSSHRREIAKKRDREEVNIDQEEYGDYLTQDETDEDDSTSMNTNKPQSRAATPLPDTGKLRRSKRTRRGTRNASDATPTDPVKENEHASNTSLTHHSGSVSLMGGLDSLSLRTRLLSILSKVSEVFPEDFTPVAELYHFFIEKIRHLPLPIFQAFVNPHVLPHFSDIEQMTLCELLLLNMIESSAPPSEEEFFTQSKLENCFLPFAAATASVADNAKVSILLESLLMLLADSEEKLDMRPSLRTAVENGIVKRADKAQEEMRRSQASRVKESLEWCWLLESGERLMYLLDLLGPRGHQMAE
ncbi:hypothetical protein N7462_007866 [Penicillium macrosclerotiorum]|uniref:uncharacterized protein n=1 Tax=Penicillium macrosclerotiorum TaxID=303699 RepID=UPI0025468FDB|nr:uncharacterized protein N7462_007866 [Penicillium macrosclerotiorum]KAJ5679622.1 hypothetical protein N7462_007866 [Penicillium macrosclerotiorum]